MDESRKQFVEFAKNNEFIVTIQNGEFLYPATRKAWKIWQESRAVIEIDAPAEPFYPMPKDNSPTDHYHYGRQSIISKVRAAGIKVKE